MDKKLKNKKVSAISLGCDKNRVDLEKMLFRLKDYGFEIVEQPSEANIVIVNTCAFISPAKEEAVDNIFQMCLLKEKGVLEKVLVSGCLPQRHKEELLNEIPEVDAFLTAKDNEKVCQIIENLYGAKPSSNKAKKGRVFTSRGSYAYLKIAEGCSNVCSYCTIPRIKGKYQSFPMDEIIDEAKMLASQNIKEIILVAQDVTRYGEDLYGKNCLIDLLKKLCKIEGIEWIRLHYAYPEKTDDALLEFMAKENKMCKYLDIPLQHIDDKVLISMRRRLNEEKTRALVKKLTTHYKDFHLRTTFIVGYPGEKKEDFKKLCDFVEETKFDYAGFFPYYREENTVSYYLEDQVSKFTKMKRLKKIQKIQGELAFEKAEQKIGKSFKVLVDYFDENTGYFVGHTEFLSPSVDFGVEIVDNENIKVGEFVEVKFTDFDGANFKGVYYESSK
ncbi:MAG: 30S ribosomal protein S12 methylthiotransferase RimO [Clostridiales bacterium]|nr:30S ribosomal protein S12 methylthiotransferase RimO [Clostridiales bacterium]